MTNIVRIPTERAALATLPKSYDTHWVASRKAQVVQAVQRGWLSLEEACKRYRLSEDEFCAWEQALLSEGIDGLKLKRNGRAAAPQIH